MFTILKEAGYKFSVTLILSILAYFAACLIVGTWLSVKVF